MARGASGLSATSVTLYAPANGTWTSTNAYNFTFMLNDSTYKGANCSLSIDGSAYGVYGSNASVLNGSVTNISSATIPEGSHLWTVTCGNGTLNNVSYWPFDENTGSRAAETYNQYNASLYTGASWVAGKFGTAALSFDGVSGYATADNATLTRVEGTNLSVMAWVYINGNTNFESVIENWNSTSSGGWRLGFDNARKVRCTLGNTTSNVVFTSATTLNTGTWYYIGCSYNLTNGIIWINGVQDATVSSTSVPSTGLKFGTTTINLTFGRSDATHYFYGYEDEPRVLVRPLTVAEMWSIYQNPPYGTPTSPANATVYFDRTVPTLTVVVGNFTNATFTTNNPYFTVTAKDNLGGGYNVTIYRNGTINSTSNVLANNTATNISLGVYPNGDYNLSLMVKDNASNVAVSADYLYRRDVTSPTFTYALPAANASWSSGTSYRTLITYTETNRDTVFLYWDGSTLNKSVTCNSTQCDYTIPAANFTEGFHWISYNINDSSGSSYQSNTSIYVDRTAPTISVTWVNFTSGAWSKNIATFEVKATDSMGGGYNITIYKNDTINRTSQIVANNTATNVSIASVFPTGVYALKIGVFDNASNTANWTTTYIYEYDAATPTLSSVSLGEFNGTLSGYMTLNATTTVTSTSPSQCWVNIYNSTNSLLTTIYSTTFNLVSGRCNKTLSVSDLNMTSDGQFQIGFVSNNSAGVVGAATNQSNLTLTTLNAGWNILQADRNSTLYTWGNLTYNITYVSWWNATSQSFVTYTVGLSTNQNTVVLDGGAVYIYAAQTQYLVRNWNSDMLTRNITIYNSTWVMASAFNASGLTTGQLCSENTSVLDNATISLKYIVVFNSSSQLYVPYYCGFTLNSGILVPRGAGYWAQGNSTVSNVNYLRRRG